MKNEFMEKRSKKFNELMIKNRMDALVVISPENVLYSTGAYIMTQKLIRDRLEIALFLPNREPIFIVCGIEERLVKKETWIKDIRPYIEFKDSPIQFLVDALLEIGLDKGRIGIETHCLSAYYYNKLIKNLPNAKFVDCQEVFKEARIIKDANEIKILAKAAKATRKAVEAAFFIARPGDTETDVANQIKINLMGQGADEVSFATLGTGEKSMIINPTPSSTPLKPGDIVTADYGGLFSGYLSDLARSAAVGRASSVQSDTYKKLAIIQKNVIESIKVGTRCCDVFNKCKRLYEKEDLIFDMPHIGHGLGVGLHEEPEINPLNKRTLQENMILNIEPFVIHNGSGYHIEDLVQVTANGAKVLTESSMSDKIPIIN